MPRARSQDFKLENMRASFLHIYKPQKVENDDGTVSFKFNGTFLWPKSVGVLMGVTETKQPLNVMEEAARVATEEWGDKAAQWIKDGIIKSPFLDGDGPQGLSKKTGERHAGFAGHRFIRAGATQSNDREPPKLYSATIGADGKLVVSKPGEIYSGCYVHLVTNLFAWENQKGGKGLSFGLNMIQFAKDGEKLGGGPADPNAFFEGVASSDGAAAQSNAAKSGAGAGNLFA